MKVCVMQARLTEVPYDDVDVEEGPQLRTNRSLFHNTSKPGFELPSDCEEGGDTDVEYSMDDEYENDYKPEKQHSGESARSTKGLMQCVLPAHLMHCVLLPRE
jgi:hypothetical protein